MAKRQKQRQRRKYEFKPDPKGINYLKVLHLTKQQQLDILKWTLYAVLCLLLLVIQDVIMCKIHLGGATTDLAVCAIFVIGVMGGAEVGGLFALIASAIYWFSGSAPGPYCIAFITLLTIGAGLFRQAYWRRSFVSITLCGACSMMLYEILVFLMGIFTGRTIWPRFGIFLLTGILSVAVMLPLYPLVKVIGKIGGETWKE